MTTSPIDNSTFHLDSALSIHAKVHVINLELQRRNASHTGITSINCVHIFPLGRTVGVALLGVIGVTALVVGVVFMNIPYHQTIGLYGTCAGAIIIATDILAIVLLVRKYYKDNDLLNSIVEQPCGTEATNLRGHYSYDCYSENRNWKDELLSLYDNYSSDAIYSIQNDRHFEALRDGRKYSVEFSKPMLSFETVITISL